MNKIQQAEAYTQRIRNPHKRAYAEAFLRHLRFGGTEPMANNLGTMAAQAVRMNLNRILPPGEVVRAEVDDIMGSVGL